MSKDLSKAESLCCHMNSVVFDWHPDAIERWRDEFAAIPRSEHCRNCPAAKVIPHGR